MKILLVKPQNESVSEYIEDLKRWGIDYEVMDYDIDSKGLVNSDFRIFFAEMIHKTHGSTIDAIQFFSREWTNPPNKNIWGRMWNRFYSGYLLSYTKLRNGYNDTARHELMHKVDNWVYVYLGIKLEDVVNVEDWDDAVVHGEDPRYKEYNYDDAWNDVHDLVHKAISYRKNKALLSILQKLIILMRELWRRQQETAVSVLAIQHPFQGFKLTQGYGIRNAAWYPLTKHHIGADYATSIGTPVPAPMKGRVVHVGYIKATLGHYCYYEYQKDGKTYQDRYMHLQMPPIAGEYKQGEIIAYTGNTGFLTGPSVHVDVWNEKVRINEINEKNFKELTVNPEIHFSGK